jgi:hypothetical protein
MGQAFQPVISEYCNLKTTDEGGNGCSARRSDPASFLTGAAIIRRRVRAEDEAILLEMHLKTLTLPSPWSGRGWENFCVMGLPEDAFRGCMGPAFQHVAGVYTYLGWHRLSGGRSKDRYAVRCRDSSAALGMTAIGPLYHQRSPMLPWRTAFQRVTRPVRTHRARNNSSSVIPKYAAFFSPRKGGINAKRFACERTPE